MDSIQQPEEEFLGIVLGVPLELKSAFRHHILQHTGQTRLKVDRSWRRNDCCNAFNTILLFSTPLALHKIFSTFDQDGDDQHIPKGQQRCE